MFAIIVRNSLNRGAQQELYSDSRGLRRGQEYLLYLVFDEPYRELYDGDVVKLVDSLN